MADDQEATTEAEKMSVEGEEEGEEGSVRGRKKRKGRKDEAKEREKDLQRLQEYLQSMAYKMPETQPKASPRTESLAKTLPRKYVSLYEEFGYVLTPKLRAKRVERKAKDVKVITTEQLQELIKLKEKRDEIKNAARKKRERIFHDILTKLENQCREQVMKEVVDKFATYLAEKSVTYKTPPVLTESVRRLTRGLVCNMYISLGINKQPCNVDHSLYETLGLILADLILEALFVTQHYEPEDKNSSKTEEQPKKKCLEQRAKRASKKRSKKMKKKAIYRTNRKIKIPDLPREFKAYTRLTRKKCTTCKFTDDL